MYENKIKKDSTEFEKVEFFELLVLMLKKLARESKRSNVFFIFIIDLVVVEVVLIMRNSLSLSCAKEKKIMQNRKCAHKNKRDRFLCNTNRFKLTF